MNKRFIWLIPAIFLLFVCLVGYQNAAPGQWHTDITDFWQKQKWHEIKALADNLDRTNRSDGDSLYLAARATSILQDPATTAHFASRFLEKRALNWNAELWLEQNYKPQKLLERVRLYRTRAITGILAAITLINLLVLWKGWNILPLNAAIACIGIVVALI
jgi:hypothetical protein